MKLRHPLVAGILMISLVTGRAWGQDELIDVKPCKIVCKLWRNFSGKAQVSLSNPVPNETWHDPPRRSIDDSVGTPQPNRLVAVHGQVVVKSAAERAFDKRQLAALLQRIGSSDAGTTAERR